MSLRSIALGASLTVAVAAAGCYGCPDTAEVVEIPLDVRVHPTTTLDKGGADEIVARSTAILQEDDGTPLDYACAVALKVTAVDPFERGDGTVNSLYDFDELFRESGSGAGAQTVPGLTQGGPALAEAGRALQIRVVAGIYWCGGIRSVAGCAIGQRIAVARRPPDREGELWAHEVGHTRGLGHRDSWVAVMHASILPDHTEVTRLECAAFRR